MEDLYSQRLRKKALRMIKDPHPPATNCSVCCRLAGGTAASGLKPPDSGTASGLNPPDSGTASGLNHQTQGQHQD
ncbi:hypothetical protein CesoFtcFv8_004454 [Champsocephalus esox]|uniref:Uncharacterized protein n=1 Tax=Champsocephalus esox TaxID=159716 RepID=A0AAN8CYR5_9TELE|nr:hypothetical protein CesoFtcFv8_004454 [Champsocephalus esox]